MKAGGLRSLVAAMHIVIGASVAVPGLAETPMTDAEVRKVDRENQKITLRHGEIRNLDMPAMTMVFAVSKRAMLDDVKVGDKVQFRAASEDGRLTVTELQVAK